MTVITHNRILSNRANNGAGMRVSRSNPRIERNLIFGNRSSSPTGAGGGGMHLLDSDAVVRGNAFLFNVSRTDGGGVFVRSASFPTETVVFDGNTFFGNRASNGGAMAAGFRGQAFVTNSILWGDQALAGSELFVGSSGVIDMAYSHLQGGAPEAFVEAGGTLTLGEGMLDAPPLFVDPAEGDVSLSSDSPCIDAADPSSRDISPDLYSTGRRQDGDLDGLGVADLGAAEFSHIRIEQTSPGTGDVELLVTGTPGAGGLVLASLDTTPGFLTTFGPLFLDPSSAVVLGFGVAPFPVTLPGPACDLAGIHVQAVALTPFRGNSSNLLQLGGYD